MKKYLLFFLATFVCYGMLFAAPRSEQQALQAAVQYLSSSSHVSKAPVSAQALSLGWTAKQANGEPAFYVFNRGEGEGFVIISAEDRTRTVLGYADSGVFDEAAIPSNTRAWLDRYARAVNQVTTRPASARKAPAQRAKMSYPAIDPICKTTWNQGAPYNNKCPMDGSSRSVTGCAATAAAQVMKVHNHPTKGTGSHSYEWTNSNGTTQTLSANFGNTTYNWASMKNSYSGTETTTQKNAVATLMYHCGVSCDMGYSANGSGASGLAMINAFVTYFGYDPAIRSILLDYMGEYAFLDAIVSDLELGRPVYFTAFTPSGGGHAFVCDGIDADGLVHINWGWGGQCDGNFVVTVLNPEEQGIGGSPNDESYTEGVTAYTQIQPNANGKPCYTITASEMSVENDHVSPNNPVVFNASTFCNQSISTWNGSTVLMVYQNGSLVKKATGYTGMELPSGYSYRDAVPMYGYLSSLEPGEYEIVPGIGIDDQPDVFVPVYVQGHGEYRCPMTVTSSEIIIGDPINQNVDPTAPTVEELAAQYNLANNIVLAVKFEEQVCNDVVFAGTYNNWNTANPSGMLHFKALEGHDDWYVVEVPYSSGAQGKPVQLKEDGTFSWDYQSGDVNAWVYQAGNKATVTAGYEHEANVAYPSAGAYIYKLAYWKNHNVPCEPEPIITVTYLDIDSAAISTEEIELHLPEAPDVEDFTFICWQPVASDITKGLFIRAIYEYKGDPLSAPAEVVVPGDHARKLVREGNIYILRDEKTYTITGQKVK